MGKVRLRHYRDTGLHRVVNRPLRATVPPGAKNAPRHARSVGEDGAGPPPRLFLCQPLPTTAQTLRQSAKPFTQALPERYAVRTGKISNIIFKKWFAGNPTREYHGVGIQCDTAPLAFFWQNGFANFGLHPFFYRRQPPFLAIGDRIVVVYQRKDNDVQALYNVSDGGAFLKNHPCYPGDRQMSLVYNLFYGMVLVIYLLILGMSLNNPYKPARGIWVVNSGFTGHAVPIITQFRRDPGGTGVDWPDGLVIVTPGG